MQNDIIIFVKKSNLFKPFYLIDFVQQFIPFFLFIPFNLVSFIGVYYFTESDIERYFIIVK